VTCPSERKPSAPIYAAALIGLLVSVGAVGILGYDIWWHLTTGWVITNLKMIPHYDLFSYTAFGAPWVDHQWIYQALQWIIYESFDLAGLIVLKFLILAAICWTLFRTISYISASRDMALWGVIVFLIGSSVRPMDRPFVVVTLFLAVYLLILHKYVRQGTRMIWALPFLQALLINIHGGGILGPIVILAFAAGENLQALAGRYLAGPSPIERVKRHRLWLVGLASLAACLINPWGAGIFAYYTQLRNMPMMLAYTEEWFPPLHPELDWAVAPLLYLLAAAAVMASHVLNSKRIRLSHLFVSAGTVLLLIRGHRFGPEMMIANLPLLAMNLSERFPILRSPAPARSWIGITAAFAISVLAFTYGVPTTLRDRPVDRIRWSAPAHSAPTHLVDFLEYYDIRGRVLNDMGLGGYLIFRRWPRERVFFDGRTPIYGEEFTREYLNAFVISPNFQRLLARHEFDYIVLSTRSARPLRGFHKYLRGNPSWHLIYAMNDGFIYLRDVPKFEELIKRFGQMERTER